MSVSAVNQSMDATTASSGSSSSSAGSAAGDATLANEDVFMQLLVAQLEHQDPDDPTSGTEFVTELAQFSELSNSTSMLADLDAIKAALTTPPSSSSGSGSGSPSGTQQTANS